MKRLPIHYAIANGASMSTMGLLVNQFPESSKIADYRGWLPLHVACGVRAPIRVVNFIFSLYPPAVLIPDEDGLVPLSLAKLSDPHPEVISFLLSAMEAEHENRNMKDKIPKETKAVRWRDGNSSENAMAVNSVTTSNSVPTKSGASGLQLV
jgi:ankyrin repeat protein